MNRYKKATRTISILSAILLISHSVKAENPPPPSSISNPFVITMLIIIGILALAIGILANVVMGAAFVQTEKEKETGEKKVNLERRLVPMEVYGNALIYFHWMIMVKRFGY